MSSQTVALMSRRWMLMGLLLGVLAQGGCNSVEHIHLYRQARQDFSDAARADNVSALNRLSPDAAQIESMLASMKTDVNAAEGKGLSQSYERWETVHSEFRALNARAASELEADQLLASSLTLQTLAKARRDLYAHLLRIEQPATTNPTTSPLTDAVAQANSVLQSQKGKLFPRDAYLLRALDPLTRYEIAYVNARSAMHRKMLGRAQINQINQLVAEIARAESDLEKIANDAGDARGSVMPHATLSRFMMLVAGQFLLQDRAELLLPMSRAQLKPGAIALGERIALFRRQAMTPNTPENDLFTRLNLSATPQNLTTWGIGAVIDEPATPP